MRQTLEALPVSDSPIMHAFQYRLHPGMHEEEGQCLCIHPSLPLLQHTEAV